MIGNILIAALIFAWFLLLGNLAMHIIEKNFTKHHKHR